MNTSLPREGEATQRENKFGDSTGTPAGRLMFLSSLFWRNVTTKQETCSHVEIRF